MYLGIEIGGTKLQLALGRNDGTLAAHERATVNVEGGAAGIQQQILALLPALQAQAPGPIMAVGIGFGGPVDDATRSIIKSHQVAGWDGFPLADWFEQQTGWPTFLGNDADLAGLAEATLGAGRGYSPLLYLTLGSGIGGGLIFDGKIARGTGRGAAEIGHLRVRDSFAPASGLQTLESIASGWGLGEYARQLASPRLIELAGSREAITAHTVRIAALEGEPMALLVLHRALQALADALCAAIVLMCPQRVVLGGGVSLMGEELIFAPLRQLVAERVFAPFAGLTDIVPAALGEEVVLHGAMALAAQHSVNK